MLVRLHENVAYAKKHIGQLSSIELVKFYKMISCVFQDFTRYKYSIRENIGLGDISKIKNDENLYDILKKVNMIEKFNT
jgi:ABC-type multidrug transport system fused ATPase/permease subunit